MTTEIIYKTKKEAIQAVSQDGYVLQLCSARLRNNEEVVMTALKESSWAMEFASKALKCNKTFVMKALNEGVFPTFLVQYVDVSIKSDSEVMTLAVEKNHDGWIFFYAKGEAALDKELAAKAIVKWGKIKGKNNLNLWYVMHPTIQEFFPQNCWYEKAQSYLNQLEQAKMVSGGRTTEDEMVS